MSSRAEGVAASEVPDAPAFARSESVVTARPPSSADSQCVVAVAALAPQLAWIQLSALTTSRHFGLYSMTNHLWQECCYDGRFGLKVTSLGSSKCAVSTLKK